MKKIYSILSILLLSFIVWSCQNEETVSDKGYLRVNVGTLVSVNPQNTRIAAGYNPKQIALEILDSSNKVVKSVADWTDLEGVQLELEAGTYTINASSNGFDGSESGIDIPYYAGSAQVAVQTGKEVTATVTCTLANVKVTVNFDESFVKAFQSAAATVASKVSGVNPLNFVMGTASGSAYFPVGDLTATIAVTNKAGIQHSQTNEITNVKARDHYILNYKVASSGNGSVNVVVDGTEKTYTYTFEVPTKSTTKLQVNAANAWSRFASLEGEVVSSASTLDDANMTFEYKASDATAWTSLAPTKDGNLFKATLKGLEPNKTYSYRLKYSDGAEEYMSDAVSFTTEGVTALVNGNLDGWYKSGKTWYAASQDYFTTNGGSFWDSSNPGTTTGAGALVNVNPTQGNSATVHTMGGQSAELKSQYASAFGIGKFAAASLYAGKFNSLVGTNGAKIDFGQPFTSRPTQLHGFFQYTAGVIDYKGDSTPADLGIVKDKTLDQCAVYIALTTKAYQVNNTDLSTFIDFNNDPGIVAYGELPASDCVSTNGAWKEFAIDLKYHSLTTKPTHIIVVCSSSKYGDYFTGSTNSVMYVDDLELIYGDSPVTK
nr:DUF4493 domain-containing protein [uncultured Bacteroides sp.]